MLRGLTARVGRGLAALASGLMLALSFPPAQSAEAAWCALVPLLVLARFTPPRACFGWGWAAGFVYWSLSLAWLRRLAAYGGPWPLVVLGWILLAAYCALYVGLFCAAVSALWAGERRSAAAPPTAEPGAAVAGNPWIVPREAGRLRSAAAAVGRLLATPLLWVGAEYLRSVLFSGFAWNQLGVSQYANLAVIQIAEWGGVYAVSALVALMNAAVAAMILRFVAVYRENRRRRVHFELMIALGLCALSWLHGMRTVPRTPSGAGERTAVRIAAVQPNVPQDRKWSERFRREVHARLRTQTEWALMGAPDLVVWPETAVPGMAGIEEETRTFVAELAAGGAPILVGSMDAALVEDQPRYFNSSLLFRTNGVVSGIYHKQHLVPFGEFVPLDKQLPFLQRLCPIGVSCTPGSANLVFRLQRPPVGFSALICFEDIVPGLARRAVRDGARFLAVQTNDAWFDGSSASVQHMSHCVFRCIENRVPAVRAANSGVTCFIDAAGRRNVLTDAEGRLRFEGFALSSLLARRADEPLTLYGRYGDWLLGIPAAAATVLFCLWLVWRARKGVQAGHAAW